MGDGRKVIDAAIEAGVKRFIPSEFNGNMKNIANVSNFPTFAERIAIMEHLKEKEAAFPTFPFATLSNGLFYDLVSFSFIVLIAKILMSNRHSKMPSLASTLIHALPQSTVTAINRPT